MIGVFSFDGPMYKDINGVYCSTTLTNQLFNRYLNVVDKLIVVIRTFEINTSYTEANLHPINLKDIEICEISNLNSAKGFIVERSKVKKEIKKIITETDLIFARMPSIISNIVIEAARSLKKPYLVEVGGCVWDSYWNHSMKGKLMAPFLFIKTKKLIKKAPYAIYVTETFLQKRYPSYGRTEVCSNVMLPDFDEEVLKKRIKKINKMMQNKQLTIGTIANVDVRYKGQDLVIKTISKLKAEGYNLQYELVGGGEKSYLQKMSKKYKVEDDVHFLGPLMHTNVLSWLDEIDVYVHPSKQEGLPRAIIEAMSRACPSIGTNIAGIPELIEEDLLFNKNSVNKVKLILKSLDKKRLEVVAIENFEKSKKYERQIIENRREIIFKEYMKSVKY